LCPNDGHRVCFTEFALWNREVIFVCEQQGHEGHRIEIDCACDEWDERHRNQIPDCSFFLDSKPAQIFDSISFFPKWFIIAL